MRLYSPQPMEAYQLALLKEARPLANNVVEWNLSWLSFPILDNLLIPGYDVMTYYEEPGLHKRRGRLLGSAMVWELFQPGGFDSIMGQSAVRFVQDFQDQFDLGELVTHLGPDWIATMEHRAYQADGMAKTYVTAALCTRVIIGNMRLGG